MIKVTLILLSFFSWHCTFSQQDGMTSQFWNNYSETNPAISGLLHQQSAALQYRQQWVNLNDSPHSIHANYNMRFKDHHGFGISYDHQTNGYEKTNDAKLIYNYQFILKDSSRLSIGAAAGILQRKYDYSNSPDYCDSCTYIMPIKASGLSPDFHAGVAYKTEEWFLGTGIAHITQPTPTPLYQRSFHFYAMGGFDIPLGREFIYFRPQFIYRTDAVKYALDINLMITFDKQYWTAISYRSTEEIVFMAGVDLKEKFRFGYSFDYPVDRSVISHNGSHEFVLGYIIK